jgi:hypothetical protein
MALRFALATLAACTLLYCARGASDDVAGEFEDGGVTGAGGDAGADSAAGQTGPSGSSSGSGSSSSGGSTGSTGPGVFDSGPPATLGGDDAGTDAATDTGGPPPTGCSLAECESYANVSAAACEDAGGTGVCVITCNGENYDVNGVVTDGCEIPATDPVYNGSTATSLDDHSEAAAVNVGSFPCDDGSSAQNLTGTLPSDDRAHSPAVDGFVTLTGSSPAFFNIYGSGGTFCQDDANFNLSMTAPTAQLACYTLTLITDNQTQTCNTDGSGNCSITNGSGSYTDGSTIYVEVSKNSSCTAGSTNDDGRFTITGHL